MSLPWWALVSWGWVLADSLLPVFHKHSNVNTSIVRLLQLPNTMVYLLWPGGVVLQVLSFVTTLYTLWQMCAMHEIKGKRFNRYHELGQYAWGQRLGLWLVIPCQVTLLHRTGTCIVVCTGTGTPLWGC